LTAGAGTCERRTRARLPEFTVLSITSIRDDEKPLDPALLRVQARLRRLMLIAGLTLGLGIVAVLAAVIYRTFSVATAITSAAVVSAELAPADLGLPAGARLLTTSSDGSRLVLTYAVPTGNALIFLDEHTLKVVGRLDLPSAP
jgi:hypothetical protein